MSATHYTPPTYHRPSEVTIELREAWLQAAAQKLWPKVVRAGGVRPERCRVSCGWPSKSALRRASAKSRRIGEAWHSEASADGAREVFVSPALADEVEVMDVLIHELIHAALPSDAGHGPAFQRIMRSVGLAGKPTATYAGEALVEELRVFAHELGRYPHAKLDAEPRTKQRARLMKVSCPDCGCIARITRTWIDTYLPTCGCGTAMVSDEYDVSGEPLALETSHVSYLTADERFRLSTTKQGRREGRWLVAELFTENEDGSTTPSERWTFRASREDALAFVAAVRDGETDFPEHEADELPEGEVDEGELGEVGDWSLTDEDEHLAEDEDELADHPDLVLTDEELAEYEAAEAYRNESGRRKSLAIVDAGGEGALD